MHQTTDTDLDVFDSHCQCFINIFATSYSPKSAENASLVYIWALLVDVFI